MGKFTFRKEERLSKEKQIQELFDKGSSFYLFPFKVFFLPQPPAIAHHQVLLSVSKKNFKRAVDRNLIKRCMRESYRQQKSSLPPQHFQLAFIYSHKEIILFEEMKKRMLGSFARLAKISAETA
jgi:ribonuclease P protein component